MKKIPTTKAKEICETYGYDYAIIIGVRASDGAGATSTYGVTKKLCKKAEDLKNFFAAQIFGEELKDPKEIKELCQTPRFSEVPKVKTQTVFQEEVR